jgi:hypothetical protein
MRRGPPRDPEGSRINMGERGSGRPDVGTRRPFGGLGLLAGAVALGLVVVLSSLDAGVDPSLPPASTLGPQSSNEPSGVPAPSIDALPSEAPVDGPPASAAVVERDIVDRPGVPPELYDKYWEALGQAGHVGTTARIEIPRNEEIVAADGGFVATYPVIRDEQLGTSEIVVGASGVTILVRDIRTGAVIRAIETGIVVRTGVMKGSLLFWIGTTMPDGPQSTDAGVWVVDIADPSSNPRAIIEPADLGDAYGPNASRSRPRIGDQGRVVFSSIVGDRASATQVIDVAGLALHRTMSDLALEIASQTALVRRADGLVVLNLATGQPVGRALGATEVYRAFVANGEFLVQYAPGGGRGVYITAIAIDSGDTRQLLHQPQGVRTTDMSPDLSAGNLIVLLDDDWDYGAAGEAFVSVTLLNAESGALQPQAFTIGNPQTSGRL